MRARSIHRALLAVFAVIGVIGCAQGAGSRDSDQGDGVGSRAPSQCEAGAFACDNGTCIASAGFCNNIDECGDGSDEPVGCTPGGPEVPVPGGAAANCYVDQLVCGDGSCVDRSAICDGFVDCNDQADRTGCGGVGQNCPSGTFDCGTGDCVPVDQRCDGSMQCGNGADEDGCGAKPRGGSTGSDPDPDEPAPTPSCSDDQFTCGNGTCIAAAKTCNFKDDCGDNSDESAALDCGCNPATSYTCSDGSCIPWSAYCNGIPNDCPGNEDESAGACQLNQTCSFAEFECYDDSCIPLFFRCDGDPDCTSGEDELGCP